MGTERIRAMIIACLFPSVSRKVWKQTLFIRIFMLSYPFMGDEKFVGEVSYIGMGSEGMEDSCVPQIKWNEKTLLFLLLQKGFNNKITICSQTEISIMEYTV